MIFLKKIIIKKKIKHKFLQLFKNGKKNCDKKKIILLEFGNYAFQHIAAAYLCDIISKKFQAKIVAYPGYQLLSSSLNQSFVKKIIWKIGNLFSINTFGIHNSFGTSDIFWPKINNQINSKALKEFINYESIIKSKVDLENYKINNILIGDLIYDSFLKKTQYPTLDINSIEFKDFFLDSLKLFYFWQNYFKTHDIKSLVLYHSVYISALPLRFAVVKKIPTYVFTMDRLYNLNNERKFYGLEYNKVSYDASIINLEKLKLDNIKFILNDFFLYKIPDTITYIYKYNSMGHGIEIFEKICKQFKESNNTATILWYNVRFNSKKHQILEENGFKLEKYVQNKINNLTHFYYIIFKKCKKYI